LRLGVLGGTFDPPHAGHLRMARLAQSRLGLDRILFVPCALQPLKGGAPRASAYHRAAMVALALQRRPTWSLDPRELEQGGISYTVNTLEALRREHPGDDLVLIVGGDSLESFPRWHRARRILELAHLAVVPRGGEGRAVPGWGEGRVHLLRAPDLDVSSTGLRAVLARHGEPGGLVPGPVLRYIVREGLYAKPASPAKRRRH
jgi:nicotinate-nucleotide adenylyltransferase